MHKMLSPAVKMAMAGKVHYAQLFAAVLVFIAQQRALAASSAFSARHVAPQKVFVQAMRRMQSCSWQQRCAVVPAGPSKTNSLA